MIGEDLEDFIPRSKCFWMTRIIDISEGEKLKSYFSIVEKWKGKVDIMERYNVIIR